MAHFWTKVVGNIPEHVNSRLLPLMIPEQSSPATRQASLAFVVSDVADFFQVFQTRYGRANSSSLLVHNQCIIIA